MPIIGHEKQWEFLKNAAKTGEFSHAYLFSGPAKLGKKKTALEMISLLFGEDVEKTFQPDLILITPAEKQIQISQIRDLIHKLSLKPHSAPLKTAIIDQAHLMNQEAQTSLLKTLEEPKGRTILFLITEAPEYLFPTIISRVETIRFFPVKKEKIRKYLESKGISEEKAEEISKISGGKPGLALDLISSPEKIKYFLEEIEKLNKISKSSISARFQYAKILAENNNDIFETLDIWLNYFRTKLISIVNPKNEPEILAEKNYPLVKLKNILKLIQTTQFLISKTNVNSRLALEILMLEF
jgi:DNA polymerase-3 subunit delta'